LHRIKEGSHAKAQRREEEDLQEGTEETEKIERVSPFSFSVLSVSSCSRFRIFLLCGFAPLREP
jgi:hypothetical protein